MNEPITTTQKGQLVLPLSLVLTGAVCWATWVTLQLGQIESELAGLKAHITNTTNHLANK